MCVVYRATMLLNYMCVIHASIHACIHTKYMILCHTYITINIIIHILIAVRVLKIAHVCSIYSTSIVARCNE